MPSSLEPASSTVTRGAVFRGGGIELQDSLRVESGQPEAGDGADGSSAVSGVLFHLLFSLFLCWDYSEGIVFKRVSADVKQIN